MSADFTKVYRGFFEGSLRDESPYSKLLFLAMLLHADENGVTLGSVSFWADYVKCSQDEIRQSLAALSSPDPNSTTTDCEGRRIEPWGDGANRWRIVNYRQYYEKSRNEDRASYKREWDRQHADTRNWRSDPNLKRKRPTQSDTSDPENERKTKGKRKEKKEGAVSIVMELGYDSLVPIAQEYDQLRKEKKWGKWAKVTCGKLKTEWAGFTATEVGDALKESVKRGWQGVFPKKSNGGGDYERV